MKNVVVSLIVFLLAGCGGPQEKTPAGSSGLRQQAIERLWENLSTTQKLEKAHAAEYLIWLGLDKKGEVYRTFLREDSLYSGESPYRIAVWRILARAATDPQQKKIWTDKIAAVWLDTAAPDEVHAAESLSKLNFSVLQ